MGTCESKLVELNLAVKVKEQIHDLQRPPAFPSMHASDIQERIKYVKKALEEYAVQLDDTVNRKRAPDEGKQEQTLVQFLDKDLEKLNEELKKEDAEQFDLLKPGSRVRKTIEDA